MKNINISQVDTVFVNGSYPIEFLFYFKYKLNTLKIRKSLKKLSTTFWPLFGKYKNGLIQSSKYIEDKFYSEKVYSEDFSLTMDEMQIWEKFNQINSEKSEGLFSLSILHYNNGTIIIPKMNHLAGDGYSYFYFLSVLAAISTSSNIPFKNYAIRRLASPRLNRTGLQGYHFNKTKIEEPYAHKNCMIKMVPVTKTFVNQEIKKIKTKSGVSISINDLLSAIVFKETFEKQKSQINHHFTISIPIDIRRQVKELGSKFFGNGIIFHDLKLSFDELDKIDIGELARKIRESMPSPNTEKYLDFLKELETKIERSPIHSLRPYDPDKGCLVTNLSRMPVQKLNFGSGFPDFIFPLTIGRNSAAILADKENFLLRLVY